MRFAPRANISRRLKTRRLARPRPSRPSSSPDPIRRRSGLARTSVDFDRFLKVCEELPDPKDAHVLAAALKTQASAIVTENLKHFPEDILTPLNMNARSSDCFIADRPRGGPIRGRDQTDARTAQKGRPDCGRAASADGSARTNLDGRRAQAAH
jgi:hypothetical protein